MMNSVDLFFPEISPSCWSRVAEVLGSKFVGEGPVSAEFERAFQEKFFPDRYCVAVNSGTSALHLAYILAGVTAGKEVVTPVFTCTATNLPILYCGGQVIFADVLPGDMNIDPTSVYHSLSKKTQAIVAVHYGGALADTKRLREIAPQVALIEDCAQNIGHPGIGIGDYQCFSFQAIKTLTCSDGGMLVVRTAAEQRIAKRLRWFGIEREAKLRGNWDQKVTELGYKYQLTDVNAAIGLGNLQTFDDRLEYRRALLRQYSDELRSCRHTRLMGQGQIDDGTHAAWICTIFTSEMTRVARALTKAGVESGPVHYENSRYEIFKEAKAGPLPGMKSLDSNYLCVPLHGKVTPEDVTLICDTIKTA